MGILVVNILKNLSQTQNPINHTFLNFPSEVIGLGVQCVSDILIRVLCFVFQDFPRMLQLLKGGRIGAVVGLGPKVRPGRDDGQNGEDNNTSSNHVGIDGWSDGLCTVVLYWNRDNMQ
eukprot:sb/3476397/